MKTWRLILAMWVVLAAGGSLAAQTVIKIACVGDSITEGSGLGNPATESYPAKLGRLLGPGYEVRNFGVSGTTLLKRGDYPYWTSAQFKPGHDYGPDLVIIKLGSNDSKPQNWRYGTNYVGDYQELIATYTNLASHPRIVLCTPCPVYGSGAFSIQPGVVATNIAPLVRELGSSLGLQVIDIHERMSGHREWFPDTVHPNSRGTTVMAALIQNALTGGFPSAELPPVGIRFATPTRVSLEWESAWAGLVLQSALQLNSTNITWTVVEQVAYNDAAAVRVTNNITSGFKMYRLWQPGT